MLKKILGGLAVVAVAYFAIRLVFFVLALLTHLVISIVGHALIIVTTIIWIVALIDIAMRRFDNTGTKVLWFLLVLFTQIIGAVLYFLFGRRAAAAAY
ncbi:MAG: PLDc N-terminal domain-containing protein [Capsulimonadaceae bacterium]